ncbi:MAG: hypothetical protein AAF961_12315 [Planctomycetota bacterium]
MIPSYPRYSLLMAALATAIPLPTFLCAAGGNPLPLAKPPFHQDRRNVRREIERYGQCVDENASTKLRVKKANTRSPFFR